MLKAYYRQVFCEVKKYSVVPEKFKDGVEKLLKADVSNGLLSEEKYNEIISM